MFDVRVNIYKFSDHDNNKFILLWGKSVCTYEYMDDLEKCNETLINKLDRKNMIKFVRLTIKTYIYLIDESSEGKKAKDTKKCIIKTKLKF